MQGFNMVLALLITAISNNLKYQDDMCWFHRTKCATGYAFDVGCDRILNPIYCLAVEHVITYVMQWGVLMQYDMSKWKVLLSLF